MKYIIFGTGDYCQKYLKYIDVESIICFVDNDKTKQGKDFYGKSVCSVQHIFRENFDYIIVLVQNYSAIVEQLHELEVPANKILLYSDLYDIAPSLQKLHSKNNECNLLQWTENKSGIKIFICIHDFNRTGVPVALMNLAILLKKMGYHVLMAALGDGALKEELQENEIDFLLDIKEIYSSKTFLEEIKCFDLIILGTLVVSDVAKVFSYLDIPIIWWIHESYDLWYREIRLPLNNGNVRYYGVGKKVLRKFSEYYPQEVIKELCYYLPDVQTCSHVYSESRIFAFIGSFSELKAQDVLISAIKKLSDDIREKCIFYFVGTSFYDDRKMIDDLCQQFAQVSYFFEMSQKEIAELYRHIDILICPSRVDSMPIVVTQALQNSIPCIVSNQVGQCKYIIEMGGGEVFPSEDIEALVEKITNFASYSTARLEEYSINAKKIFEMYFSEELMRQKISEIFNELLVK